MTDNFLDVTEEAHLIRHWPLRRPQIGFVEHKVKRLLIRLVKSFEKGRHKAPPRRVAAEFGEIDDTGERLSRDHAAKRGAHLGSNRHVGMTTAEHHDRIAGGAAVGAGAQSPPHAERIDDCYPRADIEQPLDKTFGRIGLARAGRADDCDPVIESFGGKSRIAIVQSLRRRIDTRFLFTFYSSIYSRKPSRFPVCRGPSSPAHAASLAVRPCRGIKAYRKAGRRQEQCPIVQTANSRCPPGYEPWRIAISDEDTRTGPELG